MKKIIMLFAAVAIVLGAASCQKENFSQEVTPGEEKIDYSDDPMGVIKVYIKKDDTKMAFEEKNNALYRSWEIEDVIDGCTKVGEVYKSFAYTFKEGGTDDQGEYMILEKTKGDPGIPAANTTEQLHFVYAPGAVKFAADGNCSLDLSKQKEGAIPAVMVASGTIVNGEGNPKLSLKFNNIAAVLAIKSPKLKDFDGSTDMIGSFNKVAVNTYTRATLTLNEDGSSYNTTAIAGELGTATVTGVNPEKDILVAILPGSGNKIGVKMVDVVDGENAKLGNFGYETSSAVTVPMNGYLRINAKDFCRIPVAEIKETGAKFAFIEDAIASANVAKSNVTIELKEDVEDVPALTIENADAGVTIDLKDHVINSKMNPAITCNTSVEICDSGAQKIGGITCTSMALAMKGGESVLNGGNFIGHNTYGVMRVYHNTKVTVNEGVTMKADDKSRVINAGYNSSNKGGETIINGGTFISTNWGTIRATYGNLTINGGTFVSECDSVIYASSSTGSTNITDGYFYAKESAPEDHPEAFVGGPGLATKLKGGYFNHKPGDEALASGFEYSECDVTEGGRKYTWTIEESAVPVASVNGVEYTSFDAAFTALTSATENPSTIKLLDDVESAARNWTNDNADIIFNLNGHVFSGSVDSLISTSTNLLITDLSEGATGKVTSSGTGAVSLGGLAPGNVTIEKCTIECTDTDDSGCALRVRGSNGSTRIENTQTITVREGAKIVSTSRGVYCAYGNVALCDCEITAGKSNASTAIFISTGGEVDIYEECSVVDLSNNPVLTSATSNSTQKSYMKVHGGWFYGSGPMAGNSSLTTTNNYLKFITIEGGHFSSNVMTNRGDQSPTFADGKVPVQNIQSHTHGGVSRTYGYEVKEGIAYAAKLIAGASETNYENLADAFEDANASSQDVTIKLLSTNNIDGILNVSNLNATVTLDLAGHSILFKTNTGDCINVAEGARFVLDDTYGGGYGYIEQSVAGSEGNNVSAIVSAGSFTMKNGVVKYTGGSDSNSYNYSVRVVDGEMLMQGGSILGKRASLRIESGVATIEGNSSVITTTASTSTTASNGVGIWVYGGTAKLYVRKDSNGDAPKIESNYHAAVYFHNVGASAYISAGYFKDVTNNILGSNKDDGYVNYHVTGGYYSKKVADKAMTPEPDYECVSNTESATKADYPYVVRKKTL